ncbi:MAG: polysulfide reductase NrfD [Gluconacetobacter diazotrophicus]|nr:polysulfide reductase NrfD [Gluconacetobacter diazotrophicus]
MSRDLGADLRPRNKGFTDKPRIPDTSTGLPKREAGGWTGPTYYDRPQLKSSPFNNWVVGGYVFLAGLSGGGAILAAASRAAGDSDLGGVARRGRYLTLLAPTIGSALLVWDLHTPQRFYNMMRIAKRTSPMSIGTWLLLSFTAFSGGAAAAQLAADANVLPRRRGLFGRLATAFTVPAAMFGLGISTYTPALLAATSTPLWAASPRTLAARFGSSALASAAAALSLTERRPRSRAALDRVAFLALGTELAAATLAHRHYEQRGVSKALDGGWGKLEHWGVNVIGTMTPLALLAASAVLPPRASRLASRLAAALVVPASALLRVSIMSAGDVSADDPSISFRFSQPENLPTNY